MKKIIMRIAAYALGWFTLFTYIGIDELSVLIIIFCYLFLRFGKFLMKIK